MAAPFAHDSDAPDGVVLVHGWTGTPAHLRMLGGALADSGFAVNAPLLPGHGTRVEDLAGFGWRDWTRAVVASAQQVIEAGRRLHLVGLSMGGAICLLVAPVMGAASVTTINAPMKVYSRRMWVAPLFRGSGRVLEEPPRVPPDAEALPYFQQYEGSPVGSIADLQDLMRAARRNLGAVTCPALVIQSGSDETVRPESGRIIYSGISSTDKTLMWLDQSRHNALVDVERDLIHDAVLGRISHAR